MMKTCSIDRIWLKKEKKEQKTQGGIILPTGLVSDNRTDGSRIFAEVAIIGDTLTKEKIGKLKVGDSVLINVNHTEDIKLDGVEYYLVQYHHIIAYEPVGDK